MSIRLKLKIAFSVIGIILGFSACITFGIVYNNYEASIWAFLSGACALAVTHMHFKYMRGMRTSNIEHLKTCGFVSFICGAALTIFYIFLEIYWHAPVRPVDTNIVIQAVWSFMWMKWGAILFVTARQYSRDDMTQMLFIDNPIVSEA